MDADPELVAAARVDLNIKGDPVVVLAVSGLVEGFVTPSPLPTFLRIGIGVAAEALFLAYVIHFGRKAVRAGESGDVADAPDVLPTR